MIPLFNFGFRPFFLMATIYAALMIPAWMLVFSGFVAPPAGDLALWHADSMVFGFFSAGVAGFVLTAVPSWTGTAPLTGWKLGFLTVLWLAARVAGFAGTGGIVATSLQLAFVPGLLLFGTLPIVAARMTRNYILILILAVYWSGELLFRLSAAFESDTAMTGLRVGLASIVCLVTLIGGRIVPAFTASAFQRTGIQDAVSQSKWVERAILPTSAAGLILWIMALNDVAAVIVIAAAAGMHAVRLAGWQSLKTRSDPILWILHVAYAWLVIGLVLLAASQATIEIPESAAVHALSVGAIANMLLAVMSRASLGHTGRPLKAPAPVVVAYVLLNLGALLRVMTALIDGAWGSPLMAGAALAWTGAFGLFVWAYGPILVMPRADASNG